MPPPPPYKRLIWHHGRAKVEKLKEANRIFDWEGTLRQIDKLNDQINHFDDVIMNIAKNFIPHEEKTPNPRDTPWITKSCKDFYKNYHRKYKRFVRRGCIPTEKIIIDELKNEYTNHVQTEKDTYLQKLGSEVSNPKTSQKKIGLL